MNTHGDLSCELRKTIAQQHAAIEERNHVLKMLVGIIERNIESLGEFGWVTVAKELSERTDYASALKKCHETLREAREELARSQSDNAELQNLID